MWIFSFKFLVVFMTMAIYAFDRAKPTIKLNCCYNFYLAANL